MVLKGRGGSIIFCPQKRHFNDIYRALGYVVSVAVTHEKDVAFCARVRDINGDFPDPQNEVFDATLVKEYTTGLNCEDIKSFLDWLVESPKVEVGSRDKIRAKLKLMKHIRLATWHVYCPDGMVPESQSMLLSPRFKVKSFLFPRDT